MPDLARAVRPARIARVARVVRVDARRGSLLTAVPLLALLGAVAGWRELPQGFRDWDSVVGAAEASVRWSGPIAAGLAAWTGMSGRRLDYLRALTARSPATAPLHDLTLLSAVAQSGYLAGALVVAAPVLADGGFHDVHLLGVLAGVGGLALFTVAGYLAGLSWSHPLAVVLTTAAAAGWVVLRPEESWTVLLPPSRTGPIDLFDVLRAGVLAAQLCWAAGLAAALVLGYLAWITRRGVLLAGVVLSLTVTAFCTARIHSADGAVSRPSEAEEVEYACRHWPVSVCVHPSLAEALPALSAAFAPLAARLSGTPDAIVRIEQRSGREPASFDGGTVGFHLPDLSPGYERRAVHEIESALTRCPSAPTGLQAQVSAWLRDDPVPRRPDTPFSRWTERQRRAWFAFRYPDFQSCTLASSYFF
ncbi:hypothetical protein ABGB12_24225 [Actinocorallia sp. B10E7]|uniref:hypothetical protein n=1 Tax=Actinocorallia sp. B10E7 TaxID=3153558 RepID=UPI00325E1CE7